MSAFEFREISKHVYCNIKHSKPMIYIFEKQKTNEVPEELIKQQLNMKLELLKLRVVWDILNKCIFDFV